MLLDLLNIYDGYLISIENSFDFEKKIRLCLLAAIEKLIVDNLLFE
jgi:hypothetical protein